MWFVIVLWHLILAGALFMAGLTISILRRRRRRQRLGLPVQFTPFDADGRRYDDIWLDDSGGDLVLGYRITNTTPAPFRPHPRFDGFTLIIGGVEVPHTRPTPTRCCRPARAATNGSISCSPCGGVTLGCRFGARCRRSAHATIGCWWTSPPAAPCTPSSQPPSNHRRTPYENTKRHCCRPRCILPVTRWQNTRMPPKGDQETGVSLISVGWSTVIVGCLSNVDVSVMSSERSVTRNNAMFIMVVPGRNGGIRGVAC